VASAAETEEMRIRYLAGGYGYGAAKQALFEAIIERFEAERDIYNKYMSDPEMIEDKLKVGAEKARKIAREVIKRVRDTLGY
jgi:tryptophanyl-tRNA synthetase